MLILFLNNLNAIFTASLRLFFIFNDTQQLNDRCAQSGPNSKLLLMYLNWFERNGTVMKRYPIQFGKCLTSYVNKTKADNAIKPSKYSSKYFILYISLIVTLITVLCGGIYYYRKNHSRLFAWYQRYKQLNKDMMVQNATEMDQYRRDDDENVMDMNEPPYSTLNRVTTSV